MPETDASLFLVFTRRLDRLCVPYMLTGSIASTIYGEPRLTNDVDIVIEIERVHCEQIERLFPGAEFYCPPAEVLLVEAARRQRGHFNLIHHDTGFKADIYPAGQERLARWGLTHRRVVAIDGTEIPIAPPEYVILRKLEFYTEGESEKHLRDIEGIAAAGTPVILDFIEENVDRLGVRTAWEKVRAGFT
jgi:hypothetical protein